MNSFHDTPITDRASGHTFMHTQLLRLAGRGGSLRATHL